MESKPRLLFTSFALLLVAVCVSANECRKSKTVVSSAESVTANTAAGGHIWQHVRGLTSRPKGAARKETQEGKTLFASENDYKTAWNNFEKGTFSYLKNPRQCKGSPKGQMVDCVLAKDVGVKTAYKCTAVDKNTKLCTSEQHTSVDFVEFWYAQKGGKWVLNTVYPSGSNTPTSACQKISKEAKEQRNRLMALIQNLPLLKRLLQM